MKTRSLQPVTPSLLKRLTCYLSVWALLMISPLPLLANAQAKPAANPESDWVGSSLKMLKGFTGEYMQHQNQMHQIRMQGASMAQGSNLPAPQFGASAKYFPHCKLPPQSAQVPNGQCDEASSPGHANMMKHMAGQAKAHADFHEKLMAKGVSDPYPHGITCLNNGLKKQLDAIQNKLNQLKMFEGTIAAQKQKFENDAKPLLDAMKKLTQELDGGDPKLVDHSQAFKGNGCPAVLPSGAITPGAGLTRIQQAITGDGRGGATLQASSSDMLGGKAKRLEQDLKDQIARIRAGVNNKGIKGWQASSQSAPWQKGGQKFVDLEKTIVNYSQGVNTNMARIKTQVSSLIGDYYKLPPLDSHFNSQVSDFTKSAENSLRQSYVDSCVTSNKEGMVGMSGGDMAGRLEQRGNKGVGNSVSSYQQLFKEIMASGRSLDEKLAEVKFLECRFAGIKNRAKCKALPDSQRPKNITLRLNREYSGKSSSYDYSPYELYQTIVGNCQQNYEDSGQSANVAKAIEYINEAKEIGTRFNQELEEQILERVLNCNGGVTDAGSCNAASFKPELPNFCISKAKNCATNVKSCLAKINNEIKQRKNIRKIAATKYNQAVRSYSNWQKTFFQQKLNMVMADANFFQQNFPGSQFTVPADSKGGLAIADPKLASPTFKGVRGEVDDIKLLGGGKFEFHQNLPNAIAQLQKMLKGQQGQISKTVKKYIGDQKGLIGKNKSKWDTFARQCKSTARSALNNFKRQEEKRQEKMAEQQKEQQEQLGKRQGWCNRYKIWAQNSNPHPLCNGGFGASQLTEDAIKFNLHQFEHTEGAVSTLTQAQEICKNAQDDSAIKVSGPKDIDELCKEISNSSPIIKKIDSDEAKRKLKAIAKSIDDIDDDKIDGWLDFTNDKIPTIDEIGKFASVKIAEEFLKKIGPLKETIKGNNLYKEMSCKSIEEQEPIVKAAEILLEKAQVAEVENITGETTIAVAEAKKNLSDVDKYKEAKEKINNYLSVMHKLNELKVNPPTSALGEIPGLDCSGQSNAGRWGEEDVLDESQGGGWEKHLNTLMQ